MQIDINMYIIIATCFYMENRSYKCAYIKFHYYKVRCTIKDTFYVTDGKI